MYDLATRRTAIALLEAGVSLRAVSIETGISRYTLRDWRENGVERPSTKPDCPLCTGTLPGPRDQYVYLLGLYLGDGCVSEHARTTALRISCCNDWPGLMDECARALESVSNRQSFRTANPGCHEITVLWKHWPCLFPQHGRGRKHERPIALTDWQLRMVQADPRPLIRGLIQSDGCRITNWTERTVGGTTKRYTYPRYFFSNVSVDIQRIFTDALDLLGIPWKQNRWNSISVARKEAVAALDEFVGPKY
ncbi:MAG: hypothetical protein QOD39_4569 [Mycobacterium sp.]|jgi:hypothetical protein|nr:hypothetical protein [Mycobacterium sp.]